VTAVGLVVVGLTSGALHGGRSSVAVKASLRELRQQGAELPDQGLWARERAARHARVNFLEARPFWQRKPLGPETESNAD
jgi:hypothetical protein